MENLQNTLTEHQNPAVATQQKSAAGTETTNIMEFLFLCLSNWKWYVLSVAICLVTAFYYYKSQSPMFTRYASVHIKEESRSRSIMNVSSEFSKLGLGGTSGMVENEIVAFKSPALARQVVKQLHLEVNYWHPATFRDNVLYGETNPVRVSFPDMKDKDAAMLKMVLLTSGKVLIESLEDSEGKTQLNSEITFGTTLRTSVGRIIIEKTPYYHIPEKNFKIDVLRSKISSAAAMVSAKSETVLNDKNNSVIDITYVDESPQRAEDVINTIIDEYNKNWIADKNRLGDRTSEFITERINVIQKELGLVDSDISTYMSQNLITDPRATAAMYMQQANESDQQIMMLSNQIAMCKYLKEYILKDANKSKLVPVNIGIQSSEISTQVNNFNQKMIMRNTYLNNSSESNPVIQNLTEELNAMRAIIVQALDNEMKALNATLNSSQKSINKSNAHIASSPTQQKQLLSMDRQQKIKESLYLFLLQKREENELSQAFTAYNTRIITPPIGSDKPTSPVRNKILLIAFAIALAIPTAILYLYQQLYTKIRGRKDLEAMETPLAGEIPESFIRKEGSIKKARRAIAALYGKPKDKEHEMNIVVEHGNRNIINEAFRILRSNLAFMLHPAVAEGEKKIQRQVILVTSTTPGSGKTFLTINLASAFALQKNTKVVVLDLDIRKASISKYVDSPSHGISDYLGGITDNWRDLIKPLESNPKVSILPVGQIPPNPAELLQNPVLDNMIEEMKKEYDLIILDMPPAEIVADVTIVKHLADITLYVVRAGMLERSMVNVIDGYYKAGKFKNLAVVLNGTEQGGRLYGYGYGYGYGYDYSYSYGYGNNEK